MIKKIYHIVCDECEIDGIETPLPEHYPQEIRLNMEKAKQAFNEPAFQGIDLENKTAVKLRAKEIGWHVKRDIYCPKCVRNLGLYKRKETNGSKRV